MFTMTEGLPLAQQTEGQTEKPDAATNTIQGTDLRTVEAGVDDQETTTLQPYSEPPREPAVLEDVTRFVQGLCARETEAWRNAIAREAPALQNHVLDERTFELLRRMLDESHPFAPDTAGALASLTWLELIGPHLTETQSLAIAQQILVMQSR